MYFTVSKLRVYRLYAALLLALAAPAIVEAQGAGVETDCADDCERASADCERGAGGEPSSSGCDEECPGDLPDGTCPPGCDACTCCGHATVGVTASNAIPSQPALIATVAIPHARATGGVVQRIFRPPRFNALI